MQPSCGLSSATRAACTLIVCLGKPSVRSPRSTTAELSTRDGEKAKERRLASEGFKKLIETSDLCRGSDDRVTDVEGRKWVIYL